MTAVPVAATGPWYVDDSAASGGDGTTTALIGTNCAFDTIGEAITTAESGDTIIVADGTYTRATEGGAIPTDRSLIQVTKAVTIQALSGTRPVIDASGGDGVFWIDKALTSGIVTIKGFDIQGDSATDIAIIGEPHVEVNITDNHIHGMNAGIDFWGTALRMRNCFVDS